MVLGEGQAIETPIGYMPTLDAIDRVGLNKTNTEMAELLEVNKNGLLQETASIRENSTKFGDRRPKELVKLLKTLEKRLLA
jgi:phosphoenolpyruvate carboxykinase (GTP)